MKESSIVRENMMNDRNYRGYCGNNISRTAPGGCDNPRTYWDAKLEQFVCPRCGWTSQYPEDFIKRYMEKWGIKSIKHHLVSKDKSSKIKKLTVEELISLNPEEEFTIEEIRGEIAIRLYKSENEKEIQDLWRAFKKLT